MDVELRSQQHASGTVYVDQRNDLVSRCDGPVDLARLSAWRRFPDGAPALWARPDEHADRVAGCRPKAHGLPERHHDGCAGHLDRPDEDRIWRGRAAEI